MSRHDYSDAIKILEEREKEIIDELEVCSKSKAKELEDDLFEIRDSIKKMVTE